MTARWAVDGQTAVITLDEPHHHNALSPGLVAAARGCLRESLAAGTRAVVIASSGKAFSAGADLEALDAGDWMAHTSLTSPVHLFRELASDPRPTLAAVGGLALGGGFELTLSCDLVVASPEAAFATPEIDLGVIANTGLARLPALIGTRRAMELMLTRRRMSAHEALTIGLVTTIVPRSALLATTVEFANSIVASASSSAIAALKHSLDTVHQRTDWDEVQTSLTRIDERHWREGIAAFREKRAPDFQQFEAPAQEAATSDQTG
jgi:enoyl-CoA hydratase/carnithine racemase